MTLRVTLEIVPFGVEAEKYTIHTVDISNVGFSGSDDLYEYSVIKDGNRLPDTIYHYRSTGAITLVRRALEEIVRPE